jgi:hypothetical protein
MSARARKDTASPAAPRERRFEFGAILGYELSNPLSRQRSVSASTAEVVPAVSLTPGGGSLGLVGRF